jgi:hypothetical protein
MDPELRLRQEGICHRFGATAMECPNDSKVGISRTVQEGKLPLNGVRVSAQSDTTGWYIWAGDWSDDPDFFVPLHVEHLPRWCPLVIPYLLLPPGWHFQLAPNHEDVWFDSEAD